MTATACDQSQFALRRLYYRDCVTVHQLAVTGIIIVRQEDQNNPSNRPLSRRLDRCDRVIHNESGDPNGGNMCSFSGATCTSRVRHNADYVPYAQIRFDL